MLHICITELSSLAYVPWLLPDCRRSIRGEKFQSNMFYIGGWEATIYQLTPVFCSHRMQSSSLPSISGASECTPMPKGFGSYLEHGVTTVSLSTLWVNMFTLFLSLLHLKKASITFFTSRPPLSSTLSWCSNTFPILHSTSSEFCEHVAHEEVHTIVSSLSNNHYVLRSGIYMMRRGERCTKSPSWMLKYSRDASFFSSSFLTFMSVTCKV